MSSDDRMAKNIKSLDTVKHKRAHRRGHITKEKTKLDELCVNGLNSLIVNTIDHLIDNLEKDISQHAVFQERYEELLEETAASSQTWADQLEASSDIQGTPLQNPT